MRLTAKGEVLHGVSQGAREDHEVHHRLEAADQPSKGDPEDTCLVP